MKHFSQEQWDGIIDRGGNSYSSLAFERCSFVGCGFSIVEELSNRSTAKNLQFTRCRIEGCHFGPGIVEDTYVEHLDTAGLRQFWGTAFTHVTIRGKIGRIMTAPLPFASLRSDKAVCERLRAANATYYSGVDWALDIRDAEFAEADLTGVPGTLVRRDPETQVLVRAERARDFVHAKSEVTNTWVEVALQRMIEYDVDTVVLVAPKRAKTFQESLRLLQLLRRYGVADAD